MDNFLRSVGFEPYREAIATVVRGEAVYNLEEIRKECNINAQRELVKYLETLPQGVESDRTLDKLFNDYELIANAVHFENRVLLGEDVRSVYGQFNEKGITSVTVNMVAARKMSRKCLAEFLESI